MERITVDTTLNVDDWHACCLEASRRYEPADPSLWQRVLIWVPWVLPGVLLGLVLFADSLGLPRRPLLWAMIAVVITNWVYRLLFRVRWKPSEDGIFLGPTRVEFAREGVRMTRARYDAFASWSPAMDVTATAQHLFLWLDRMTAQVVPVRDLGTLDVGDLTRKIRACISGSAVPTPTPTDPQDAAARADTPDPTAKEGTVDVDATATATAAATAAPELPRQPTVARELRALLTLTLLGDPDPRDLHGRDLTIFLLSIAALAVAVTLQYFSLEGEREFTWWNLAGVPWTLCVGLGLARVLARRARPRLPFRRPLLLVAWFAFLAAIAHGVGGIIGMPGAIMAWSILAVLGVILFSRGLLAISGGAQRLAFFAGVAWIAVFVYLGSLLYFTRLSFWYVPDPEMEAAAMADANLEELRFAQPLKLDRALAALERGDADGGRMFFLGFAGYGDQRVFAGEIDLAARRVHERYGTGGRALRLVNDRRDLDKHPFATVPALRHALAGIASKMNRDEDVLFLALSSHGSEDAKISVQNSMEYFSDLRADVLAQMLRDSGIRWKVIVVSACHAGGFIEPLKDSHTIVIAAAAQDRTSFGCSDDRDVTYFGEAFYRDALPESPTLLEAFAKAKTTIERREREEGITESRPQAHFGAEIASKLAIIEAARVANPGKPLPGTTAATAVR
jgi:hypothetical protein